MYLVPESHTLGREAQCMLRVFYDFKRHWGKRVARNITQGSKLKMEYEGFTIFTEAYILLLNSGQAGNGDDCGFSWCCLPCFSGSTFSENPVRFHSSTPFKVRL